MKIIIGKGKTKEEAARRFVDSLMEYMPSEALLRGLKFEKYSVHGDDVYSYTIKISQND